MSQIFESVRLALSSIWANKLRSLLTLLGNIVAVASIITVVALITGVNGAVSDAIVSDLGADSFTVQRMGFTQNEDDFERMRNNPIVTTDDAEAIKRFSQTVSAVMAQGNQRVAGRLPRRRARVGPGAGRQRGIPGVLDVQRRARPDDQRRSRSAASVRWRSSAGASRIDCSGRRIRSTKSSASPASTFACSASARRRARPSATRSTSS